MCSLSHNYQQRGDRLGQRRSSSADGWRFRWLPVPEAATHSHSSGAGSRKVCVLLSGAGWSWGERGMQRLSLQERILFRSCPSHTAHFVRGRKLGESGKGLVAREAREPGWSQRPGAASAFKMQIDSSHYHPPPAPGARLRGSATAHASCALRRPSGRLYLRGARGATRHLPGARGRGGRSAPGLSGAHGGALVLLGSARLSAAAGALG